MPIKIHLLPLGALQTNCYIVADTDTHEAVIIDPVSELGGLAPLLKGGFELRPVLGLEVTATPFLEIQGRQDARCGQAVTLHGVVVDRILNRRTGLRLGDRRRRQPV